MIGFMILAMELLWVVLAIVIVIIVGLIIEVYNTLVSLSNNVKKAWADIDVLLEKRHDALGKLIDTAKAYMQYEKGLMTQITQLRSSWTNIPKDDVQAKMNASNQISSAIKSLFAVAENYPDLKADASFMQIQQTILDLESQLADRREFYNQSVTDLNIRVQQIPYNIFASIMHFTPMPLFQVAEEEKPDVKMSFNISK